MHFDPHHLGPDRPPRVQLRQKWRILTPSQLGQRCEELVGGSYLIEGLIPQRSLSIVVGDSGLGKSPLLYQAALCVAVGSPFLGHRVSRGPVLVLDFENGLSGVEDLLNRLAGYLRLPRKPENLLLWNYNDASPTWKSADLRNMIRDARPALTIIDSLSSCFPEIEEKSSYATRAHQEFRKIAREFGTSITCVHHIRKPSTRKGESPPSLQDDPQRFLLQARGARAIINGCDVRIGVDHFRKPAALGRTAHGHEQEIAFVIGGFARLRGNLATTFVARVLDDDGEPMGYEKLAGVSLLFNSEQEQAYQRLPATFRFKNAQQLYGRRSQATDDFLKKCLSVGILRKVCKTYCKVTVVPDQAE
jgi:AAA domain-containing protein